MALLKYQIEVFAPPEPELLAHGRPPAGRQGAAAGRRGERGGGRTPPALRLPSRGGAIQVAGVPEFMAHFEAACRERGVKLFVLPPRSPKLNGHVERAQRTHKEEFYYRLTSVTSLTQVNKLLRRWEDVHTPSRPHQALGQTTPLAFYRKCA